MCTTHEFTVSGDVSSGAPLKLFLDLSGSVSVTVRSFDACTAVNDSVRDGLLNDCKIAHSTRVTKCPTK
jgi:hypothetical protein